MIKTIIIDDERWVNSFMRKVLSEEHPQISVLGDANSVKAGLELIKKINPDLVFLDINMRDGTGFDLLDQLPFIDFKIIFITAYNDFAIKAFKYAAQDYLLKPIHLDELKESISKVIYAINQKVEFNGVHNILDNLRKGSFEKITIQSTNGYVYIELKNLIRIESAGNYCVFYTTDGRKYISSKILKEYESILDKDRFIRIHRSHLINLQFVKKLKKTNSGEILMTNGDSIPISRSRKDTLLDALNRIL